jgi:hypothetical protein
MVTPVPIMSGDGISGTLAGDLEDEEESLIWRIRRKLARREAWLENDSDEG